MAHTNHTSAVDIKTPAPATKLINNISISTSDVQIDPSRSLWFRLFTPSTNSDTPLPLIVYFHGGGFSYHGPDTKIFDDLCSHLAAKVPAVVASVNYRLAPDHKYPTQYEDGYDALKFIDSQNAAVLPPNTDLGQCFIGGDSAGGNITHHVTVRAVKNADQFHKIRIAGTLSIEPAFGGVEVTESELTSKDPILTPEFVETCYRNFLPEGADRNHPSLHVFGGESTIEIKNLAFPPTLVIAGGNDPLRDWDKRYVEWLKGGGKEVELTVYPNVGHAFYTSTQVPEFDLLLQRIKEFIHKKFHSK